MASPPFSITTGITFFKCPIYLWHLHISTVDQNVEIPSTSSCLLFGLISLLKYSLISCQGLSIGFKSGDSGGVHHQFMPTSLKNLWAYLEQCLGSLSCINLWEVGCGNLALMKGRRVLRKISQYNVASIFPSNMHAPVAPFLLIPTQTCTSTGCLGRGFGRGFMPSFLQQERWWVSSCTLVSSLHMTSSNVSVCFVPLATQDAFACLHCELADNKQTHDKPNQEVNWRIDREPVPQSDEYFTKCIHKKVSLTNCVYSKVSIYPCY